MPTHNRKRPTEITIKVFCCRKGMTLTTKGDYKNKRCWNCDSDVVYTRYPEISLKINSQDVTKREDVWHVVSEVEVEDEDN